MSIMCIAVSASSDWELTENPGQLVVVSESGSKMMGLPVEQRVHHSQSVEVVLQRLASPARPALASQ